MADPPAVEFRGLVKYYGPVRALDGVDLRVEQGEVFGFLGPNGAGKTTAIRCLLDLIRPTAGQALVLAPPRPGRLTDRLEFAPRRPVGSLSRGNRQKLGLILAMMHQPDVLVLDEPTSGLDPLAQETVEELLQAAAAGRRPRLFFSSPPPPAGGGCAP